MSFEALRLENEHSFDFFDCGEESLNSWAIKHAYADQRLGKSATHVWVDAGGCYVLGYFTLLPTLTGVDDGLFAALKPRKFQGNELPGVLIGKLALDNSLRGTGAGIDLLADAIVLASDAMSLIGGVHIIVDPMSDRAALRQWYLDAGFNSINGSERLYLNIRG